nr:methyltransferase protein 13 [Hymenolepis microstoma]
MSAVLPKKLEDFGSSDYWNNFFTKRDTSFEWYGDFATLVDIFVQNIRKTDTVLEVGCGNSNLSAEIYDKIGCAFYLGIDYSPKAIEQSQKLTTSRRNLRFEVVDVFKLQSDLTGLELHSEHFNCIIDKGTLDAIDNGKTEVAKINLYFENISSVLSLFGRYIIVTLAQDHIVKHIADYFLKEGSEYMVSCFQVTNPDRRDGSGDSLSMPLFAFVMTKMKASPSLPQLRLKSVGEDQPIRHDGEDTGAIKQRLIDWIKYLQTSCILDQSRIKTKGDREFEIAHEVTGITMFTCRIASSTSSRNRKPQPKGVLLVPQDQAVSFATPNGALVALNSMGRLSCAVLAFPNPSIRFASLDVAKSQLSDGLCASPLASAVRNAPIYSTPDNYLQMKEIKENPPYALITEALKKRKPPPRLLVQSLTSGNVYRFISSDGFSDPLAILLLTWITLTRRLADNLGYLGAKFFYQGVPPSLHKAIMSQLCVEIEEDSLKNLANELNSDIKYVESQEQSQQYALMCYTTPEDDELNPEGLFSFMRSAEKYLLTQGIGCIFRHKIVSSSNLEDKIEQECGSALQMLVKHEFETAVVYVIYRKKQKLSKAKFVNRVRQMVTEAMALKCGAFGDAESLGCSGKVIGNANKCLINLIRLLAQ